MHVAHNPTCKFCKTSFTWFKFPWYSEHFCNSNCHSLHSEKKFDEHKENIIVKMKKSSKKSKSCSVCKQVFEGKFLNQHNIAGYCHAKCKYIDKNKKELKKAQDRRNVEIEKEQKILNEKIIDKTAKKCAYCQEFLTGIHQKKFCDEECKNQFKIRKTNTHWVKDELCTLGKTQELNRNQQIEYSRIKIQKNPVFLKKWSACRG